ncbi:MAG: M23 family metallopeptidase [Acidobacteriota bacterium]
MIRSRTAAALFLVCFAATGILAAGEAVQGDGLVLEWSARALYPGEVLACRIAAPLDTKGVVVQAFGSSFPAFRDGPSGRWTALVGIDLDLRPGRHELVVESWSPHARHRLEAVLRIHPKEFPVRRIQVEDRYATPPAEVMERIRREQELTRRIFQTVNPEKLWEGPFLRPVPGEVISTFGKRSIVNGQPRSPHSGTDFRAAAGTPIRAPNAGRVVLGQELYFSGNTVILDHGGGLYSYFAHLSEIMVQVGDNLKPGEILGRVGATGRVTGPHLHWSVRLAGARVDPLSLLRAVTLLQGPSL